MHVHTVYIAQTKIAHGMCLAVSHSLDNVQKFFLLCQKEQDGIRSTYGLTALPAADYFISFFPVCHDQCRASSLLSSSRPLTVEERKIERKLDSTVTH